MIRIALSLMLISPAALAFEVDRDSAGAAVSWHHAPAFVIDSNLATQLEEPNAEKAIEAAVATYNAFLPELGITVTVGPTSGVGYQPNGPNENSISAPAEWEFDEDAIAITIVTTNSVSNELLDTDIALNTWNHIFRALDADTPDSPFDDIQNTVTHELGHSMGMAHNADDTTVVMYPTSPKGQISKRTLTTDDQAGLRYLYAALLKGAAAGCSATSGGASCWPLLILLGILLRRFVGTAVRLGAVGGVLVGLPAFASSPAPTPAVRTALSGVVTQSTTETPRAGDRLLHTFVVVRVEQCLSGSACPATVQIEVPGGTFGGIEQRVIDSPSPIKGEQLGLVISGDPSGLIRPTQGKVFHLSDGNDVLRFLGKVSALQAPASAQLKR